MRWGRVMGEEGREAWREREFNGGGGGGGEYSSIVQEPETSKRKMG